MECKFCGKECKNSNSLRNHERLCHNNPNRANSSFIKYNKEVADGLRKVWNKCLTKETDTRIKQYGNTYSKAISDGYILPAFLGKSHTAETKQKISCSMKIAHTEGRAHVWEHKISLPTRPEQFMIEVLKNEFNLECGVDYFREVPFHGYFLDFCFIDKKLVIEMDGEQHYRLQEQIERDIKKDALLSQEGYKELRIPWKDCFHNPKKWILELAKFLSINIS